MKVTSSSQASVQFGHLEIGSCFRYDGVDSQDWSDMSGYYIKTEEVKSYHCPDDIFNATNLETGEMVIMAYYDEVEVLSHLILED